MSGNLQIQSIGPINTADGTITINVPISITTPLGVIQSLGLNVGNNTVVIPSVPVAPTVVIIQPPAGNTNALILKGVNGDTGVLLHKTQPSVVALDPTELSIVINVATATTTLTFTFL